MRVLKVLSDGERNLLRLLAERCSLVKSWLDITVASEVYCNICSSPIKDPYIETPVDDGYFVNNVILHGKKHLKDSKLLAFL